MRTPTIIPTLVFGSCLIGAGFIAAPQAQAQSEHPILKDVRQIMEEVAEMRGLKYQAPVKADVQKPEVLKKMIRESFDEEASAAEMAKQEKVIKAFGLLPQDYELRAALIKFMSEQIGGFYDPEKKELFLIERPMGGGAEQKLNDQMVMAHELHHALQDQNFALDRWFDVLGDHEDRLQAYKGLIEGEAQLIGMSHLFGKMGRGKADMRQLNRMQEMMLKMSPEGAKFRKIPPYLIENMMFPYTQGAEFVQDLQRKFGWQGLNKFFNDPPSSTEQILHPEKYFGERDEPLEISLPGSLSKILGKKPTELYENTLGEFSASLLLRALGTPKGVANKAVHGWDGDRFAGFETADGRVVVIWLSTWDSETQAAVFENTYRTALKKKRPGSHLVRRGTEVLWVYGSKGAELKKLVTKAFKSLKLETRYAPMPAMTKKPPLSDFTPSTTAEEAPAPARTSSKASSGAGGLVRVESLGLSFALPSGYEAKEEPIAEFAEMTAAFYQKGKDKAIRIMAMPFDLGQAVTQARREMEGRGWTVSDAQVARGKGLEAKDEKNGDRTLIHFVGGGEGQTVAIVLSARKGQVQAMRDELAELAPWVDQPGSASKAAVHRLIHAGYQLSVTQVLDGTVPGDPKKGVVHGQFSKRSRAIVTVRPARGANLDVFGRRLTKQLERSGVQLLAAGVTARGKRDGFEVEFRRKGRHYRQLTVLAGGRLWTVSCSAQEADFDGLRASFGTLIAGFKVVKAKKREVY
ncbi:MAG: hypothetical protein JKY65_12365 [Planctomycetes bacterium]|nr:hypothetical protein [Planctomycetota bacterium]